MMSAVSHTSSDCSKAKAGVKVKNNLCSGKALGQFQPRRPFWYHPGSGDTGADGWVSFTWEALHTAGLLRPRAHLFESV